MNNKKQRPIKSQSKIQKKKANLPKSKRTKKKRKQAPKNSQPLQMKPFSRISSTLTNLHQQRSHSP